MEDDVLSRTRVWRIAGLLNIDVHYYSALELTPVEACKHVKGKIEKAKLKLSHNYHYQEVLGITNRKWWTLSCGPPKAH